MFVVFEGYTIDIFLAESGNLGITVMEKNAPSEDAKSVDIFVSKDAKLLNR